MLPTYVPGFWSVKAVNSTVLVAMIAKWVVVVMMVVGCEALRGENEG